MLFEKCSVKERRIFKQLNSLFVGWYKDGLLKLTFINERSPDLSIRSSFSKEPVSFKLVISYNHQKYFRSRAENEKFLFPCFIVIQFSSIVNISNTRDGVSPRFQTRIFNSVFSF